MERCPACGRAVRPRTEQPIEGVKEWTATLAPLGTLSELLDEITGAVVDQYTPPSVSRT